jgi:hypothetical protein
MSLVTTTAAGTTASAAASSTAAFVATASAAASSTAAFVATAASAATSAAAAAAATTTSALEVRVADNEPAAHQTLDIVDLRAVKKRRAVGIYENLDGVSVDNEVVVACFLLDAEDILHASSGTRHYHYPEHAVVLTLFFQNIVELLSGHFADFQNLGCCHSLTSKIFHVD